MPENSASPKRGSCSKGTKAADGRRPPWGRLSATRIFAATLGFDDPEVGDKLALPTVAYKRQFAREAVIPLNAASGKGAGVIGDLHFLLDDIATQTLGRPIFMASRGQ